MPLPTPPALSGLPLVGNAPAFFRDSTALVARGYREHGRLFSLRLGPKPMAVLIGPEYNRFFCEQTDKILSMRGGYPFFDRMFGEGWYFMAEPHDYREQRAVAVPAFQGRKMHAYVPVMQREAMDFIGTLGDSGEFDVTETMGPLAMYVAARGFLGADFRESLGREWFRLFRQFGEGISVFPDWFPLPQYMRSAAAKRKLDTMVDRVIRERRQGPTGSGDFLDTLLEARYSTGERVPDRVIQNLILLFVFAGHETTAGHLCWALIHLLQHPEYLARVRAEQDAAFPADGTLTLDAIKQLERLEWSLKETERLAPAASMLLREAVEGFELGGYSIPKGWLVATCSAVSHRLPEIFRNPDAYDPDRFSPERNEEQPYSLIGFGGGVHRCPGFNFAYLEMKVVISLLLQHYELELRDRDPKPVGGMKTRWPASPARIRYRRRRQAVAVAVPAPRTAPNASPGHAATGCPFHADPQPQGI